MRKFTFLLILTVLLNGCAKSSSTDVVGDAAKESINAIVENKPECKSVGVACNKQIDAVISSCNGEKSVITEQKVRWKYSFFALLMVMVVYIVKRLSARW